MKIKLLILLSFFCFISGFAQKDLEHWFPPFFGTGSNVSYVTFYISTDNPIPFKVKVFNDNKEIESFIIDKLNPHKFVLKDQSMIYTKLKGKTMTASKMGIHLAGEYSFYASCRIEGLQTDVIASKGKTALGNEFYAVMDKNILFGKPLEPYNSLISLMATLDDTHIHIDGFNENIIFTDGKKHSDFDFVLNKGESYIISFLKKDNNPNGQFDDNDPNMIGAHIVTDKKIVITSGNMISQDARQPAGNINIDQTLPVNKIGHEYFISNGFGNPEGGVEKTIIVATEDNTDIFFNNETSKNMSLNKGESYIGPYFPYKFLSGGQPNYPGSLWESKGMYIKASKPIYLYQLMSGHYIKPPQNAIDTVRANFRTSGMTFSFPLDGDYENYNKINKIQIPEADKLGLGNYNVKLIFKTQKGSSLNINGTDLIKPSDIIGKQNWEYYVIPPPITGNLNIESNSPLNMDVLGGDNISPTSPTGFAYSYTSFSNDPYILVNGNCIEEGLLLKLNNTDFDKIQWQKNGVDIPGANAATYIPTEAGIYTCVLTYSGINFTTNSFNIAHCPYTVVDKDYGKICDDLSITAKFSPPNESQTISKLEILAQPYNGKVAIDNLNLQYIPDAYFTGDDRFVYRMCTAISSLCETVKATLFVNEKPKAEIVSEIYPISESNRKGIYDLTKVIIEQGSDIYNFYEDVELKNIITIPNSYETNLLKAFVKIESPSGCFIIKEIKLLVLEENITLFNYFSPNGDGSNDVWDYSKLKDYSDLELYIYTKYGTKVFEHSKTNFYYNWDGKNNSGKILPTDNYWSIIKWKNSRTGEQLIKQMWLFLKNR